MVIVVVVMIVVVRWVVFVFVFLMVERSFDGGVVGYCWIWVV